MPGGGLARMRGGPRQIQDSQRGGGGGGSTIKMHPNRGDGATRFFIFVLFSNKYFQSSRDERYTFCKPPKV